MNDRPTPAPPPAPGPLCAVYAPLLPLLDARALAPEQEADLREHLAGCAWCQNQRTGFEVVEAALRRHYGASPSAEPLTLEAIMRASDFDTRPAVRPAPSPRPSGGGGDAQRRRRPWAGLGALAAAALLVALAAALFAGRAGLGPWARGGGPASGCAAALPGAAPAAAIAGFPDVTFPAGAAMTSVASSAGGPSRFTLLDTDVCYSGAADDLTGPVSGRHSVTAKLLGAGWSASPAFPSHGDLLQPCPEQCYRLDNTRYLGLERITDRSGGVFTYHLRLAAPPPAPTCGPNFANSPLHGAQAAVEGVPLPPLTFVVPDNAPNLRGYDLCSSGDVASITAFLNTALPAAGWGKVGSNAHCFYADQCWTKSAAAISWRVDQPTDWHIAYRPSAG